MKLIIYKIPSDIFPVADAVGSVISYLLTLHDGEWWVQWVMLTFPIEILGFKSLWVMAARGFLVSWKPLRFLGYRCIWWGIWSTSLRPDHCLRSTQFSTHFPVDQIVLQDRTGEGEGWDLTGCSTLSWHSHSWKIPWYAVALRFLESFFFFPQAQPFQAAQNQR